MPIDFKSESKILRVLTPEGQRVEYEIEQRTDPLTSRISTICPHLKDKWVGFYGSRDEQWLSKIVEQSRSACPFCPPRIDEIAARFPPDQIGVGLLKSDDIYVFPNLFPRADFEAVVTSPSIHYLDLNRFSKGLLYDYVDGALDCVKRAHRASNALHYGAIGCNYLPPAGASLMHLHMQISMRDVAFNHIEKLIEFSDHYSKATGSNFWTDLMKVNTRREIKREPDAYWYVPFAPNGFCEIRAILNKSNFLDFTKADIEAIAEGLSNVLTYYHDHGFASFNFVIYSGALAAKSENFRAGARIVARPSPRPNYVSIDSWYMPWMLEETIVLEKPEALAHEMKSYFTS